VKDIKLIATDLDGTLIGRANDFPFYSEFRQKIDEWRVHNDAVWTVCTGRSRRSFRHFFNPMSAMGLTPDYIIISHAYVYSLTRFGYFPHVIWNLHIHYLTWKHGRAARSTIRRWHAKLSGGALGVKTVSRSRHRLYLRFDSDESARVAADMLQEESRGFKNLMVFRYLLEVEVRLVPFTKGMAVAELSRHLGLSPLNVLAIGNGHNDISMLSTDVATHTGCPANSEAEVINTVHQRGGHIAGKRSLTGVIEILDAWRDGNVSSAIPSWFDPAATRYNPRSRMQASEPPRMSRSQVRSVFIGIAIAYAVLVVFAGFGLVPGAAVIMKPYDLLIRLVERALSYFYVHSASLR